MTPVVKLEFEHACPQLYLHFQARVAAHMHTHTHVHIHENVKSSPKSDQDHADSEQCGMLENNCGSAGHVNPKAPSLTNILTDILCSTDSVLFRGKPNSL